MKGCAPGQTKRTGAHDLPCKHVLHTVGPEYEGGVEEQVCEMELASCYTTSLDLAAESGIRSVCFACISTSTKGFPKENAAEVAVRSVLEWYVHSELNL